MGRYRKLMVVWALSVVLAALLLLAFSAWIDALGLIDPNKNLSKRIAQMARVYKPWAVYWLRPRSVALGNSRFVYGISMEHPGWESADGYNMSLSGITINEIEVMLQHALNAGPVQQLVMSLDDPCDLGIGIAAQLDLHRLLKSPDDRRTHLIWLVPDLFSTTALFEAAQDIVLGVDNGFERGRTIIFNEYDYQSRGQAFVAKQREARTVHDILTGPKGCNYNALQRVLEVAYTAKIDTKLVINPRNMRMLQVQARFDGDADEKGDLAMVLKYDEEVAARHGAKAFPLYYFASVNPVTTDFIQDESGKYPESAFWYEASHYKKQVGDWILDRVLGVEGNPAVPDGFGVRLTLDNLDEVFSRRVEEFHAWAVAHPDVIRSVNKNIDDAIAHP